MPNHSRREEHVIPVIAVGVFTDPDGLIGGLLPVRSLVNSSGSKTQVGNDDRGDQSAKAFHALKNNR